MASKEGGTQRTICEFDDVDKVPWRRAGQASSQIPTCNFSPEDRLSLRFSIMQFFKRASYVCKSNDWTQEFQNRLGQTCWRVNHDKNNAFQDQRRSRFAQQAKRATFVIFGIRCFLNPKMNANNDDRRKSKVLSLLDMGRASQEDFWSLFADFFYWLDRL